jgi:hypothetical protein
MPTPLTHTNHEKLDLEIGWLPRVRRVSGFVQIRLSQVPRRDVLGSTPISRAGALVDRVLRFNVNCGIVDELWLPRIAVVRSRPPSVHRHREVAVPRPSAPPADSRCGLRRRSLEKS